MVAGVEILTFHIVATTHHTPLNLVETAKSGADASAARSGSRPVYFDGGFVDTPIYEHDRLLPGNRLSVRLSSRAGTRRCRCIRGRS